MLSLKARLGLHKPDYALPDDASAEKVFAPPLNADAAQAAGDGSVTLTHDIEGLLPLKAGKLPVKIPAP